MTSDVPSRPTAMLVPHRGHLRHRLGQNLHVGLVARDHDRLAVEDLRDLGVALLGTAARIVLGVLARQVADVEVDRAQVGHAVHGVAADDPAEADRRAVEQVGGLARERQRLDAAEGVDRLDHRVVAQPRASSRAPSGPDTCSRSTSTPLAWTPMCRSVGSPVIAKSPDVALLDQEVRGALLLLVGLLVADAHEVHLHRVLGGQVAHRAHHRREAALHVVGAAADQAVALDPRLELRRGWRAPRRGGRAAPRSGPVAAPTVAASTGRPLCVSPFTSTSRASSHP